MDEGRRILIVTPTLGESRFLDQAVESVAAQPLVIKHVISAPVEKQRRLQDRFRHAEVVFDAGRSGGVYGALNSALLQAGEDWDWFGYINDDDALLPGFAEVFRRHLRRAAPEPVVYGDVELVDELSRCIALITTERNPAWIPPLLQAGISPLTQQGMLFRRDIVRQLQRFDARYRLCADLDFWLRAYVLGAAFKYYPKRVAQFRLRRGQLSGGVALTIREQSEIVARLLPAAIPSPRRRIAAWRYRLYNIFRYIARTRTRGFVTSYHLLQNDAHRR